MKKSLWLWSVWLFLWLADPVGAQLHQVFEKTLQNAETAAAADGQTLPVIGYNSVSLDVTISGTATVNFEAVTRPTAAYTGIACVLSSSATGTLTATATGQYQCNVAGMTAFRARISGGVASTVTVFARATTGTFSNAGGGGGAASANPSPVTEGQSVGFTFDLLRNLYVTLGTLISGEDQANDVLKVEQRMSSSGTKTADAQIKSSPGFVHTLTCYGTDNAATAGTIILYDNTAESGTVLYSWTVAALDYHIPFTVVLDVAAATGIYLGYTTTSDVNCTVSYR